MTDELFHLNGALLPCLPFTFPPPVSQTESFLRLSVCVSHSRVIISDLVSLCSALPRTGVAKSYRREAKKERLIALYERVDSVHRVHIESDSANCFPLQVPGAQDLVDFSPVYRCLHIYTVLVSSFSALFLLSLIFF